MRGSHSQAVWHFLISNVKFKVYIVNIHRIKVYDVNKRLFDGFFEKIMFYWISMKLKVFKGFKACIVCHSVCIFWMHYSMVKQPCSNVRVIKTNFSGVRIFKIYDKILTATISSMACADFVPTITKPIASPAASPTSIMMDRWVDFQQNGLNSIISGRL